ncbi:MAG: AmmeMemoRadiSam system protein B [Gammaproteobacteria bacterium]
MARLQDNQARTSIRPAAVAGMFYPGNAVQLDTDIDQFLQADIHEISPPKAIIVPHAGYVYSGAVAASAYANLLRQRAAIKRVVLLGPAHRVYVEGMALPTNTHFATPLGNITLDTHALADIADLPFVEYLDAAHRDEHSLEVQLPFLQKILDDFVLVPIVVGNASPEQVELVLERLWGGPETLVVISSDLSHYHDYQFAKQLDTATTELIESFAWPQLGPEQACGCMPMRGLLKLARQKNMTIQTLDLRNSGDTAGPRDKVVGYGAYALHEQLILSGNDKDIVFDVMRHSIKQGLHGNKAVQPDINDYTAPLTGRYAMFVTLKLNKQLRGCIGNTEADRPLIEAAAYYAHAAAFSDPRFPALREEEFANIEISLSILTPATRLEFSDEQELVKQLRPGIDGLIIESNTRRATFLPAVWESITEPARFLSELKQKAGIAADEPPEQAWRYTAECYS